MSALSSSIGNQRSIISSSKPDNLDELEILDQKINQIREQVNNSELALRTLTDELENKHEIYVRQIEDLKSQIDAANREAENAYVMQQSNEQQEYLRLHRKLEAEILQYQAQFDAASNKLERSAEQSRDYADVRKAWQITDMMRSLQIEAGKVSEYNLTRSLGRTEKKLQKRAKIRDAQMRLKTAEDELSKMNAQVKEFQANCRIEQKELQNKLEMSEQNHKLLMQKLVNEQNHRDKDYIRHLDAVRLNIYTEKQRMEYDTQSNESKIANLQTILKSVQKQGLQQMSLLTSDIQKLQTALDAAEQSESKFSFSTKGNDTKMQDLRTKHAKWKSLADGIIEETEELKIENQKIVAELEKIENKSKLQRKSVNPMRRSMNYY
ncbi:hypothetical protein TVAG_236690 [Trichomonas vaginalis G3]|uniref:Uncharacterized protein n=1 Tax=Trichomonas vaginalis (strain ATCC PRA-98 / G3) TaxID=412133 RepID=A2F7A9_TRIV3|nr:hypothetical protein TVAGG3_0002770 [Trichomonas vaginalis G3]EAX99224.1 hypothetical protein TVAG_236690 [Trichomonas vaginalis G3]KAI5538724.1 hypothetical protein TVAGG3_0002770 [Trichomonas vaginalis G3]|eukprot:XP_001312154.1 hypothetical protein [Trichomonas vaginalis G3]